MIIWPVGTNGQTHNYPYNNLIIDWSNKSTPTPVVNPTYLSDWTLAYRLLFGGMVIIWGGNGQYSGYGGVDGTSGGGSVGPLQLIMSGVSSTIGTVQNYSDGIISVTSFSVSNKFPVIEACQKILKQTGKTGRTYKLAVIQNGKTIFTVRSIYWGTQQNLTDDATNDQLIDRHYLSSDVGFANP